MSLNDATEPEDVYPPSSSRIRYSGGLRASDAEREATATVLRNNYTAGRLDQSEYEERVNRCYAAKWVGELADLTLDLPRQTPPESSVPTLPAGDGPRRFGGAQWWPVPLVPVLIAIVVLGAITHGHAFWMFWPLLFFFWFRPWGRRHRDDWRRGGTKM